MRKPIIGGGWGHVPGPTAHWGRARGDDPQSEPFPPPTLPVSPCEFIAGVFELKPSAELQSF